MAIGWLEVGPEASGYFGDLQAPRKMRLEIRAVGEEECKLLEAIERLVREGGHVNVQPDDEGKGWEGMVERPGSQ